MSQKRSKKDVGTYALIHGTKAALKRFNKISPKYTFLRTSINNCKFKLRRTRKEKLFSNGNVDQICFQMT